MGSELGKALVNPITHCCEQWAKYVCNDSECTTNSGCCSCSYATHATPLDEHDEADEADE